jgi:hypothetical protein
VSLFRSRSDDVFDVHLTVSRSSERIESLAAVLHLKYVRIELSRGAQPDQSMLTGQVTGDLRDAIATADKWTVRLQSQRIWVSRRKIETAPWNAGVPADDDAVREPGRYFEHHIKVLVATGDLDRLAGTAEQYGAHASRNARRTRPDGRQERFVTLRCLDSGRSTAIAHCEELIAALDAAGFTRLESESEYVMVDTNLGHDAGSAIRPSARRGVRVFDWDIKGDVGNLLLRLQMALALS